jgi:hypothetical protein
LQAGNQSQTGSAGYPHRIRSSPFRVQRIKNGGECCF